MPVRDGEGRVGRGCLSLSLFLFLTLTLLHAMRCRRSADDGRSLRQLLPDDFNEALTVEDIIPSLKASRKAPLSLEDQFQTQKQQSVPEQRKRPSLPSQDGSAGAAVTAAAVAPSPVLRAHPAPAPVLPRELTEQQEQELRDRERERELLQLILQEEEEDDELAMAPGGIGAGAVAGFSGSVVAQGPSSPLARPTPAGAPVRPTLAAKQ